REDMFRRSCITQGYLRRTGTQQRLLPGPATWPTADLASWGGVAEKAGIAFRRGGQSAPRTLPTVITHQNSAKLTSPLLAVRRLPKGERGQTPGQEHRG